MNDDELQDFFNQHAALYMLQEIEAAKIRAAQRTADLIVKVACDRVVQKFVADVFDGLDLDSLETTKPDGA